MYGYPNYYQVPQKKGIEWTQGIEAARAYPVAPGDTAVLFDSEKQTVYLKTADATGRPTMTVLDYTIRTEPTTQNALFGAGGDVRQEITEIKEQIKALKEQIGGLKGESPLPNVSGKQ